MEDQINTEMLIISYSEHKHCRIMDYPPDQEIPLISPEITNILLHDVILMNVRSYTMKYEGQIKREALEKSTKINDAIEELINSDDTEDMKKVNLLKEEAQELEDEREATPAKKYFAKMQLEGGKPTKFFCNMNKKRTEKAQFEELHIVEKKPGGEEQIKVITEQKLVEW